MKNFLYRLLLTTNSGIFNQAIMEIGALVCTRYNPRCNSCPLRSNCKAFLRKSPYSYPEKKGKKQLKIKHFFAIILKSEENGTWNMEYHCNMNRGRKKGPDGVSLFMLYLLLHIFMIIHVFQWFLCIYIVSYLSLYISFFHSLFINF